MSERVKLPSYYIDEALAKVWPWAWCVVVALVAVYAVQSWRLSPFLGVAASLMLVLVVVVGAVPLLARRMERAESAPPPDGQRRQP